MRSKIIYENYILYEDGTIFSNFINNFMKFSTNGRGYRSTLLTYNGKHINIRIHRLVAENFVDNPMGYSEVNHIDGNKDNNHANNLEWCTRSENIQHAYDNGLRKIPSGENNPRCKVSEEVIHKVCKDILNGMRTAHIAKKYGIAWHIVDKVRRKENWKTVSDNYF